MDCQRPIIDFDPRWISKENRENSFLGKYRRTSDTLYLIKQMELKKMKDGTLEDKFKCKYYAWIDKMSTYCYYQANSMFEATCMCCNHSVKKEDSASDEWPTVKTIYAHVKESSKRKERCVVLASELETRFANMTFIRQFYEYYKQLQGSQHESDFPLRIRAFSEHDRIVRELQTMHDGSNHRSQTIEADDSDSVDKADDSISGWRRGSFVDYITRCKRTA